MTTNRRDVNELVDSLLARPATPLTGPSSTRPSTIGTPARPSGSTPPASIPGTPGGGVSRLSNDGSLSRAAGSTVGGTSIGVPGNIDQCVKVDNKDSCESRADGEVYRESMASPSPFQAVDFVDHQAELFELPSKVRLTIIVKVTWSMFN